MGILFVGLGGAIGAVLRYLIGLVVSGLIGRSQVINGTVLSNLAGCLLAGILLGIMTSGATVSDEMLMFLSIGVLGSLTTFSTFALEIHQMLSEKQFIKILIYLFLQLVIAFLLVFGGYELGVWAIDISGGTW